LITSKEVFWKRLSDHPQAGIFYRNRFVKQSSTVILIVKQNGNLLFRACEKYSVFVVFSFAAAKSFAAWSMPV
jgi:hypothetical protein